MRVDVGLKHVAAVLGRGGRVDLAEGACDGLGLEGEALAGGGGQGAVLGAL